MQKKAKLIAYKNGVVLSAGISVKPDCVSVFNPFKSSLLARFHCPSSRHYTFFLAIMRKLFAFYVVNVWLAAGMRHWHHLRIPRF